MFIGLEKRGQNESERTSFPFTSSKHAQVFFRDDARTHETLSDV